MFPKIPRPCWWLSGRPRWPLLLRQKQILTGPTLGNNLRILSCIVNFFLYFLLYSEIVSYISIYPFQYLMLNNLIMLISSFKTHRHIPWKCFNLKDANLIV